MLSYDFIEMLNLFLQKCRFSVTEALFLSEFTLKFASVFNLLKAFLFHFIELLDLDFLFAGKFILEKFHLFYIFLFSLL